MVDIAKLAIIFQCMFIYNLMSVVAPFSGSTLLDIIDFWGIIECVES